MNVNPSFIVCEIKFLIVSVFPVSATSFRASPMLVLEDIFSGGFRFRTENPLDVNRKPRKLP